ncbi:MAG: NADPH-dependent FMN reductase [Rhodospirillaceae bacterium]|nr:NADPH-dependent FMN reductase [Rhodospirillaceae bacterium]
MSKQPKILAFAGSLRDESLNKLLVRAAAKGAEGAGAEVTAIDLKDYPMPIYDGDIEAADGLPENALKLKELFEAHDALLIASPEYNSSISPVLKNTLDWVSRPAAEGETPLSAYNGKVAALVAASPGGLGGLRGLVHLRQILGNINVLVIPDQRAVGSAFDAFDENGDLKDEATRDGVEKIGARLAAVTAKQIA